jgi:hypothetical protein
MAKPSLEIMQDPLACANVMAYRSGEALNWHFDCLELTTTWLLQAPAIGGQFECRKDLRSDNDPGYAFVAQLLKGKDQEGKRIRLNAGTPNVFLLRNAGRHV